MASREEFRTQEHREFVADPESLEGGFLGDHFLPANTVHGGLSSSNTDPRLAKHLKRQRGVRKGTMGAFVANYRLAQEDMTNSAAIVAMQELLCLGVVQLG